VKRGIGERGREANELKAQIDSGFKVMVSTRNLKISSTSKTGYMSDLPEPAFLIYSDKDEVSAFLNKE